MAEGKIFICSADWMPRNLNHRVEIAVPLDDRVTRKQCLDILTAMLADRAQSWVLNPDGTYTLLSPASPEQELGVQEQLMIAARESMAKPLGVR